jgi:hypothetical protein
VVAGKGNDKRFHWMGTILIRFLLVTPSLLVTILKNLLPR